jgi:hypothetical protein
MGNLPKAYGFAYAHNGWNCSFRVLANSEADAKERAAAMTEHKFVGELKPVDLSCVLPQASDSAQQGCTHASFKSSAPAARPTKAAAQRS